MGLFGGTTIAVASSAYNMAGDIHKRINYLKTAVTSSIISTNDFSLTDTLSQSYMNGPGIKTRNFCRWAVGHFGGIGVPEVNLSFQDSVSFTTIQGYIPVSSGQTATVIDVRNDAANPSYWAERWLMANQPTKLSDTWTFVVDTGGTTGTITYSDATTDSFPIDNYDITARYIYVIYSLADGTGSLGSRIWIYKVGDGHTDMDTMVRFALSTDNTFFPIIPIRWNNNFLSSTYMPDAYKLASKAYKKATGQKFDKLVSQLQTNSDIGDIQFIYVVYGCSLNTVENAAKKYIFKLFEQLASRSTVSMDHYNTFLSDLATYNTSGGIYPYLQSNRIEIRATGALIDDNYDVIMSWAGMSETTTTGIGNGGSAKPGDCWFNVGTVTPLGSVSIGGTSYDQGSSGVIQLNQQMSDGTYKTITIANLQHENKIYKDKSVITTAIDALNATDESEFIVPLSYEIQREMSIVDSTQMMTSAAYLVMNCYKIHKKKWYETTFFMIIVVIAIIAIAVATGGIGAGTVGLLGTAGSVGAAVGLTGLAAVIAGTIINMLAAMILTKLIGMFSVAIFGPKLGAIIGAIISVIAISAGTGLMNGQSLTSLWGNMTSAQSLIGLTEAAGNGVANFIQQSVAEVVLKTQKLEQTANKDSKDIEEKYIKDFGIGSFGFDPFSLTDIGTDLSSTPPMAIDTPDQFLQRTLMTGTDIAQISIDMISSFTDLTLVSHTTFSS